MTAAAVTPPPAALRAVRDKLAAQVERGAAARAWADMPVQVRTVLVMLACEPRRNQDATGLARMPWGSFTQAEQCDLGALARTLRAGLAEAGQLR